MRPAPERIAAAPCGHAAARWLSVAIAAGVFTELGRGPRTLAQLVQRLGLQPRPAAEPLDALVALGLAPHAFEHVPPRFRLSAAQRRRLWRAIYERIESVEPAFFGEDAGGDDGKRCPEKRRPVLA